MTTGVKDVAQIVQDRRDLLQYLLEDYKAQGGKVVLPIGCSNLENWLLDTINVDQLLEKLIGGAKTIDALHLCHTAPVKRGHKKSASNIPEILLQPSTPPKPSARGHSHDSEVSAALRPKRSDSAQSDASQPAEISLQLPQLQTAMDAGELKDLAYNIFASCCGKECSHDVLINLRSHFGIPEARAFDIEKTLKHLENEPGWSQQRAATLELQMRLLEVVRPKEFSKFRHFVQWRNSMGQVLLESLQHAIRDGWDLKSSIDNRAAPTAKSLVARLKGALRRLDVRSADDYFDTEYDEAVACVSAHARNIASHVTSGWRLPWGLRIRTAENMLLGMFDSLEESVYIHTSQELLSVLENGVWKWLGIVPLAYKALLAWVHFKQYIKTHDGALLQRIKQQLKQLHEAQRKAGANKAAEVSVLDKQLAQAVMDAIMNNMQEQLSDYHITFQDRQSIESMNCLVDVLVLAAELGGSTDNEVQQLLMDAVGGSVDKEMARRMAAMSTETEEEALKVMADTVREVLRTEQDVYLQAWKEHLPQALSVVAFRLHRRYGAQRLLPWISSGALDGLSEAALQVVRVAEELEAELHDAIMPAFKVSDQPVGRTISSEYRAWEIGANMQPALAKWVLKQTEGCSTWVTRGLGQEKWEPVSREAFHSLSSQELMRILHETLNALFDFNIRLQPDILSMLLESMDHIVQQYALQVKQTLDKLGTYLVPPVPNLARYKQKVVVQQERAEVDGKKNKMLGLLRTHGHTFVASVERVESSPAWSQVTAMKDTVLNVMLASLQFLLEGMDNLRETVVQRWDNRRASGSGRTDDLLEGILEGARQVLRQCMDSSMKFYGDKIVFWDMRQEWLEMLYRHRVDHANIDSIRDALADRLQDVCSGLPEPLRNPLATAILDSCCQAFERVLLNGGPCRWFIPDDVTVLRADLDKLQNLFLADGHGVEWNAVKNATMQLNEVLRAMGTQTGPLMQQLEQARLGHTRFESMYMCILAHRADKMGSKYLKLHYKVGKPKSV